ncbi:Uncharacterized protein TCM_014115 [Theobroma cacao]|uniref:Reverse transcriptase domain-containing protein n=1 Tax=Theobroma cacao TaxID=3641 RepID=A0A061FWM0_THECC|nr:Uncharacterized protein TCM_014115 [Theobroma cacao]
MKELEEVVRHFQDLYKENEVLEIVNLGCHFNKLFEESVDFLERPFEEDEIWETIQGHDGNKAPGPNGYNLNFFKKQWPIIKRNVMRFMDEFFSNGKLGHSVNTSFIALIPKVPNPTSLSDSRPISLVNSLYKILANRLKTVIGMVLKLDFEKAFDSISWNFLDHVMGFMGFGVKWRCWIKECISTAKISILVNGSPSRQFGMERGFRQGCPLSPLLFNIAGEAFSAMLCKVESIEICKGVMIGRNGLSLTHLQYADDTIIFCDADLESLLIMKRILKCYQSAEKIMCKVGYLPTTYLRLPLGAKHNSTRFWDPILEKVKRKLAGWKTKMLSFEGRITLLKSVLTSMPVFFMSLFQVPHKVKNELEKLQRRFLWGGDDQKRKIHLVKWDKVCNYKDCRGIDITDIEVKNHALLNKWIWRYGMETDNL